MGRRKDLAVAELRTRGFTGVLPSGIDDLAAEVLAKVAAKPMKLPELCLHVSGKKHDIAKALGTLKAKNLVTGITDGDQLATWRMTTPEERK